MSPATTRNPRPPNFATPEDSPQDPRRWWLPMGMVVACVVAAFWAGVSLRGLTSEITALRKDMGGMISSSQFERWSYQTEKLNPAAGPWRAAEIPKDR